MFNTKMEDFYNRPYINSIAKMEIRKNVQYVGRQLLLAMTTDDMSETEKHITVATTSEQNVMKNLELLSNNFANKDLLKKLEQSIDNVETLHDEISELALNTRNEEALETYNNEYNEATLALQDVLVEISQFADQAATNAYRSADTLGIIAMFVMR